MLTQKPRTQNPEPNSRLLGLDPGYGRLGFGIVDVTRGKATAVSFGVITTLPKQKTGLRLKEIADDVEQLIVKHRPNLIAIEELFFVKNITTGLKVAEVRGVLLYLAEKHGLPVVELKPIEIKLALTGYGQADKRQMQQMVKTVFGLPKIPKPDDAADALAIAWAASNRTRY